MVFVLKRWKSTVALVLALLLGVVAGPAFGAEKVTITHLSYASHSESWHDFLREMKVGFEQEFPDIEVNILVETNPPEKFAVMMVGGNSPDVLDMSTTQAGPFIAQGDLLDLYPYVARDGRVSLDLWPDVALDGLTDPQGRLVGLPMSFYPIVTWYNKDLLAQAGLSTPAELGDAWNWDALRSYGQKLTKDENGDGQNEIWGIDRIRYRAYIQVRQAGGFYYDRETLPTESHLTSEPVVQALEFLHSIVVEDVTSQPPGTPNQADTYLWKGRAAVDVVDGPGIIGSLMKDVSFDWDIAPQPMGPANNGSAIFPGSFQISKHSKLQDAAWEWVRYIAAREEAVRAFTNITGRMPAMNSVARDYDAFVPNLPENWMTLFDQTLNPDNLMGAGVLPDSRLTSVLNTQLNEIFSGSVPVRPALEEAHRQSQSIFEELK